MQQPINNNKQQTAVDIAFEKLANQGLLVTRDYKNLVVYREAKELEKEQMDKVSEDWFVEGCSHMKDNKRIYQSFEQYYNKTYNQ
jgi:hypothetical protein